MAYTPVLPNEEESLESRASKLGKELRNILSELAYKIAKEDFDHRGRALRDMDRNKAKGSIPGNYLNAPKGKRDSMKSNEPSEAELDSAYQKLVRKYIGSTPRKLYSNPAGDSLSELLDLKK